MIRLIPWSWPYPDEVAAFAEGAPTVRRTAPEVLVTGVTPPLFPDIPPGWYPDRPTRPPISLDGPRPALGY